MEMPDYEIGSVQIDVNGGLCEEEATDATAHKHGHKTQRKKARGGYPDIRSIKATQPDQSHDRRWNGDGKGRKGKQQRGKRVHAADEHVMTPNHVAQEANGNHRVNDHLGA